MIYVKGMAVWGLIAFVEVLHGIARARLLAPKVGDLRSRQIGVFTGSPLILALACAFITWIGPVSDSQAVRVGTLWFAAAGAAALALSICLFKRRKFMGIGFGLVAVFGPLIVFVTYLPPGPSMGGH